MSSEPLFQVQTEIGDGPIRLDIICTEKRWEHAVERHPEVRPYLQAVRLTVEEPWAVYETPYSKPTYAFYRRELIADDPRFRGSYVAVLVRYGMEPAQVWTAYLPTHISTNLGKLVHLRR